MSNAAEKIIPIHSDTQSITRTGTVTYVISDEINVNLYGEIVKAKKMFSCLIDPEPGDRVLCSQNENGLVYIVGIIERPASRKMKLTFPSDVQIQAGQGNLNVICSDNITIASKEMNCFSNRVIHKSREAMICYENIIAKGTELQAGFKTVRLISNLINTMAKQVIDKFKRYVRTTEDHDMVKAGHFTRNTDGMYSVDSNHTMMKSKKTTIIDGEKILMG